MKTLNQYIVEKLILKKNLNKKQTIIKFFPKTKAELKKLLDQLIDERGNEADLNDIDTSAITDMAVLFDYSDFNGDISEWDVSNVNYMKYMFAHSKFDGDLSGWNVNKVTDWANFNNGSESIVVAPSKFQ